jgi:hypothetical protein
MLYTAKCYWPGVTESELERMAARASQESDAVYAGSLLFPDDELVLCLFDSASPMAVIRASEQSGIPCERVMGTVWLAAPSYKRRSLCEKSQWC